MNASFTLDFGFSASSSQRILYIVIRRLAALDTLEPGLRHSCSYWVFLFGYHCSCVVPQILESGEVDLSSMSMVALLR